MGLLSRLFGSAKDKLPHQSRIVGHVAFDGAIRVFESPAAEGWQHAEDQRRGDGFTVMVLKYILPMSPMPLALLAKIYTNDRNRAPPTDPANTDWQSVFQGLFSSFLNAEVRPSKQLTMTEALDGFEAILDGIGADPATPLRMRERRTVVGREQFIVSAIGSPSAFVDHEGEIDRWFSTTAFVPLEEKSKS